MGRPGPRPPHSEQGPALQKQVDAALAVTRAKPQPISIDPALIMKVRTTSPVDEANWRQAGLRVVGGEHNHVQILFASDEEMAEFRQRLGQYSAGERRNATPAGPNYSWLADLDPESFVPLGPEDRQGRLLRMLFTAGGPDPDIRYALEESCDW
ncbi:MAG TPA: hypothetical protein DEV93_02405 [Chloroflexi bacterium]|nr:hypothetical protein [Chloroflexota bacterium]